MNEGAGRDVHVEYSLRSQYHAIKAQAGERRPADPDQCQLHGGACDSCTIDPAKTGVAAQDMGCNSDCQVREIQVGLGLRIRLIMVIVGYAWILALPYEGLWKGTYIDEHALQPGQVSQRQVRASRLNEQVTMYFDWPNVHEADRYLDHLEQMVNATLTE